MDLTLPLRTLVPSLDASVFSVLVNVEAGMSLAQIARLAPRGSRNGLMAVLNRHVRDGLVISEPSNTGSLYRLNRSHVLFPALIPAAAARREIVVRLTDAISAMDPPPVHSSIFGSFARGGGGVDSDIDVLIVTDNTVDITADDWLDQMRGLADDVRAWTGNPLGAVVMTRQKFRDVVAGEEAIVESWQRDSIGLVGASLGSLMRDAASSRRGS